ncbi:MAG: DegT/DnrJ/EryC1/StrS aminotransferase family protein, partial [Acetobacteraceae bacterium]|nr:DegT/DnrJ/EryC1/StrS aminotransferase family protein [Acetobacteraceae bacterium]
VQAPLEPAWCRSNWQSYAVRLGPEIDQTRVMQSMLDDGIATRRGIMCAHLEPAYAQQQLRFPLPESERARNESVLLPLYPQMTGAVQEQVIEALVRAIRAKTGQEIRPERANLDA